MARKTLTPEQLSTNSKHLNESLNNGTDLACALIGTAAIEQALGSLLNKYLLDGTTSEKLLAPNGILGTLNARIEMAYCLGITGRAATSLQFRCAEIPAQHSNYQRT
jgi:hypothetical protein